VVGEVEARHNERMKLKEPLDNEFWVCESMRSMVCVNAEFENVPVSCEVVIAELQNEKLPRPNCYR
jgi:hypothetical protein